MSPELSFRHGWTLAVRDDAEIPPVSKLLAWVLASHMGADGRCYPSVALVATEMSVSRKTVQNHLGTDQEPGPLIAFGYLRVNRTEGGTGHTHDYQATLPNREQGSQLGTGPSANVVPAKGERGSHELVRELVKGQEQNLRPLVSGKDQDAREKQDLPSQGSSARGGSA